MPDKAAGLWHSVRQRIARLAGSEFGRGVLLIVGLVLAVLVAGYLFVGYL